jgi:hypothetical protein
MKNKFLQDRKGFSSKGHITKKELAGVFLDSVKGLTIACGGSLVIFQDAVLKQSWMFLSLWGIIFAAIFIYTFFDKISRDGDHINNNIHKELLDQPTNEE